MDDSDNILASIESYKRKLQNRQGETASAEQANLDKLRRNNKKLLQTGIDTMKDILKDGPVSNGSKEELALRAIVQKMPKALLPDLWKGVNEGKTRVVEF